MRYLQIFIVLSLSAVAAWCSADTVVVKDGNVLVGELQTPYIGLETPYQNLFFNRAFVSEITREIDIADQYAVITINNDIFRGKLINSDIDTAISTGEPIVLPASAVRDAYFDAPGETKELETTVFFINNGDRFSGKLLTPLLTIHTGKFPLTVKPEHIARIIFMKNGVGRAEVNLVDGTRLVGGIQEAFLRIAPDSAPPVNICTIHFASIQFNALKYIKKRISPDDYADPDTKTLKYLAFFQEVDVDITDGGANCGSPPPADAAADDGAASRVPIDDDVEALGLTTILFDTDQSDIKPVFFKRLTQIAEFLKNNPAIVLQINGHTDNRASAAYNEALSLRRAASVGHYMEQAGVSPERIRISGYGFMQPVADNKTDEGKSQNRRVELKLVR